MKINTTKIQIALIERNMTQKSLAEMCNIHRQNVNAILKRGTCAAPTLGKICKALDIPVKSVLPEED